MAVDHDAVAALAPSGPVRELTKSLLLKRMPYVLADADNPQDFVAVDTETGAAVIDIMFLGRLFHYDPTDGTTAHDGVTCLVTQGGRRYKLDELRTPVSVLDKDLTAPPDDPAIGDTYLLLGAPSGDWASLSVGSILYLSARGWEQITAPVGTSLFVEDEGGYYHRDVGGDWVAGFGSTPVSTNAIPLGAAINFGRRAIVENKTTNAPPVSPTVGVAYVIGSSPTGAWSGNALKLAICEVAGSFTIYAPSNGWLAFDKSLNQEIRFDGSAWISAAGSWVDRASSSLVTSGSTTAATGSTRYIYSATTAPTTSSRGIRDNGTQISSYAAKRSGARLRFEYQADGAFGLSGNVGSPSSSSAFVAALFQDSITNAVAWQKLSVGAYNFWRSLNGPSSFSDDGGMNVSFDIDAPDTSAHNYFVAILSANDLATPLALDCTALTRRRLTVQEAA